MTSQASDRVKNTSCQTVTAGKKKKKPTVSVCYVKTPLGMKETASTPQFDITIRQQNTIMVRFFKQGLSKSTL